MIEAVPPVPASAFMTCTENAVVVFADLLMKSDTGNCWGATGTAFVSASPNSSTAQFCFIGNNKLVHHQYN